MLRLGGDADDMIAKTELSKFERVPVKVGIKRIAYQYLLCGSGSRRFVLKVDTVGDYGIRFDKTLRPIASRAYFGIGVEIGRASCRERV